MLLKCLFRKKAEEDMYLFRKGFEAINLSLMAFWKTEEGVCDEKEGGKLAEDRFI